MTIRYVYVITIAMRIKKPQRLHLEIQQYKGNYYGVIRSSYRKDGKVKHTNYGRLTGMNLNELKLVQTALRGDVVVKGSPETIIKKCVSFAV